MNKDTVMCIDAVRRRYSLTFHLKEYIPKCRLINVLSVSSGIYLKYSAVVEPSGSGPVPATVIFSGPVPAWIGKYRFRVQTGVNLARFFSGPDRYR